jgi:hypothetical protein
MFHLFVYTSKRISYLYLSTFFLLVTSKPSVIFCLKKGRHGRGRESTIMILPLQRTAPGIHTPRQPKVSYSFILRIEKFNLFRVKINKTTLSCRFTPQHTTAVRVSNNLSQAGLSVSAHAVDLQMVHQDLERTSIILTKIFSVLSYPAFSLPAGQVSRAKKEQQRRPSVISVFM